MSYSLSTATPPLRFSLMLTKTKRPQKPQKPQKQSPRTKTTKSSPSKHRAQHPKRSLSTTAKPYKIVTNNVFNSFSDAVGNTPLIRINFASKETGCEIYAKFESANPGGSVKDRAAKFIIDGAEERGELVHGKPGVILDASAGNTGIGLTLYGNSRGYRTCIVIPDTQTQAKKDTLKACGALLIENGAFPFKDSRNYVHVARRLAHLLKTELQGTANVFYANQWDNTDNAKAHETTTGPEIFHQLASVGLIPDAFNCAIGTGGSIVGTSRALRKLNPNVHIAITDPLGALPTTYYNTGELKMGQGGSITEGIGQSRITGNLGIENWRPDTAMEIPDEEAMQVLNRLNQEEGLQVGLSSGINVAGAIALAKKLGPGKTVVTLLCDNAMRYESKMYNLPFLQSKSLTTPYWMDDDVMAGNITKEQRTDQYKIPQHVPILADYITNKQLDALVNEAKTNLELKI